MEGLTRRFGAAKPLAPAPEYTGAPANETAPSDAIAWVARS
jgi:hypothetical protein